MIKVNIMPLFNFLILNDNFAEVIFIPLIFFYVFDQKNSCCQKKKHVLNVLDRK